MKPLVYIFLPLLLLTGTARAQPSADNTNLEGVWKGFVITDQQVPYEVVVSSSDGVYSGYSMITFTVNGKKMYAVKKLKIDVENGEVIMKDDDHLFDNFQNKAARDFEQTNTLSLSQEADMLYLNGKFVTKPTRQFKARTGQIKLEKLADTSNAPIVAQLKEMTLWSSLSFLQPRPEPFYVMKKIPLKSEEKIVLTNRPALSMNAKQSRINYPLALNPKYASEQIPGTIAVKTPDKKDPPATSNPSSTVVVSPKPATKTPTASVKPVIVKANPPVKTTVQPAKPVITTTTVAKANPSVVRQNSFVQPVSAAYSKSLEQRKIETIQTLYFKSDSLMLTLYDNGEVDGDTVSLIMNGKMLLSRQGLTTNPINKTVYTTPDLGDTLQLIMYAENLGSLPPNSGLLIVYDGTDRYEIRFSGDLQKNAAITFRRRKTEN